MTEHANDGLSATDASETPEAGTPVTPEAQNGSQGDSERQMPREQRYRLERNAAREELAAANARLERMQRAEIERLAADSLSHPSDLFSLSGNGLEDYLTESGDVDPEKVADDVAAIVAERPGLRKVSAAFDPSQGRGGSSPPKKAPTFSDLLEV